MNKIIVNNYKDLSEYMLDVANDGTIICSVLFYDGVSQLMRELLRNEEVSIGYINFSDEDYFGYDREYYVTLDTDLVLDILPAWEKDAGYVYNETDIILFDGESRSSIVPQYEKKECYELHILDENCDEVVIEFDAEVCCEDCCEDCNTCSDICEDDDFPDLLFSKFFMF